MNKIFFDTNILIYSIDQRDPVKYARARDAFASCINNSLGVISMQVLQEFATVALIKIRQTHPEVIRELSLLEAFEIVIHSPRLIHHSVELAERFKLNFWDAAILAAAEEAGCDQLYSEDFPDGAVYGNLRVVNPLI